MRQRTARDVGREIGESDGLGRLEVVSVSELGSQLLSDTAEEGQYSKSARRRERATSAIAASRPLFVTFITPSTRLSLASSAFPYQHPLHHISNTPKHPTPSKPNEPALSPPQSNPSTSSHPALVPSASHSSARPCDAKRTTSSQRP